MTSQDTNPTITTYICERLLAWKTGDATPAPPAPLLQASMEQDSIGWHYLLQGCVSTQWQITQARWYESLGSKLSAKRWTAAWIRKLWDVSWDQWEHRNDVVHKGTTIETRKREMIDRIRQEWTIGYETLHQNFHRLFRGTVDALILKQPRAMEAWLEAVRAARQASANQQAGESSTLRQQRQMMYSHFGRPSQPPRPLRTTRPQRGRR